MTKDEIKAGDRINTPKGMGTVKYAFGGYLTVMLDNGEWWVNMNAILPKEDKPTDEIKVGDRVKFKSEEEIVAITGECYRYTANLLANKVATIEKVTEHGYGIFDGHISGIPREIFDKLPNIEDKTSDNTITIPIKVDLDDTYWDVYRAELVKELAVKLAHDTMLFPAETAERVVRYADAIVDNLKKEEKC